MAGKQGVSRLLTRHRASLVRDLDTNKILPHLVAKEVISTSEERQVLEVSDRRERTEVLLDILGKRGLGAFHDFCSCLEKVSPHLLTGFLLDNPGNLSPDGEEKKPTQALQLSLELALNERDLMLRENVKAVEERDQAIRQLEQLRSERNSVLTSLENITGKPSKNTNSKSDLSPATNRKSQKLLDKFKDMEPETDQEDGLDNVAWETHTVTLRRVPGFGFGIAVSGGRDNPHFANGDPSIAISDVLTAGPAEGKLLINDRVMNVNGIPLENVEHKQAIAVLKDSGNKVNLVIRRRVLVPTYTEMENTPLKITLSRKNRREDIGVVLGCKFYIKEITGNSLAAQDGGLKEGDVVLKINSTPVENLSLVDAKKVIEKTKDKLQLFITKSRYEDRLPLNKAQDDEYSLGYGTLQGTLQTKRSDIDNVNIYRPSLSSPEEEVYKNHHNYQEIPPGSYPSSEHARYDGRYIYDHEAPPRPPLPDDTDAPPRPPSPGKELLRPDDFYSPRSPRVPHSPTGDGYMSDHGRMDPHMQRRHHDERYVGKRKDIVLEPRFVYFEKEPEFGLGLRLAGGNATGIFIASVQPGSGAEAVGLTEGDQILKANDVEIPGMTREDAVTYLTSLEGRVSMVVQYKREEYDRIISSHEAGDSFFIRTHFEYQAKDMGELSFTIGDIFHIKDTLFRGVVGYWLAMRIGRNNQETQKGFIPNRNSAEQLFLATTQTESEKENTPTKSRSLIFKRKSARRSKSLGKDHWEDVIFSNLTTKFPAYERVTIRDPGFVRPVVIFGALADVARDKLLQELPDKFESPQADTNSQGGNDQRKSGIIRLGAIKEIISKRKHCLLDVTPHNVDKLNYSQYYPIVVFLKAENKTIVKECRAKFAKGSTKNHKKLFEQSQKLEKLYPHLFTATISHNNTDIWYQRMLEMIFLQQNQQIWMSEHKPEDNVNDDFLFPMGGRIGYSSGGGQENEPSTPTKAPQDDFDASPKHKKRLVRSSSDPSINTTDRVPGIPPYPAPPSYHRSPVSPHRRLMDDRRYVDFDRQSEDRYFPSYYASESLPHGQFPHNRSIEPYATITPHERLRSKIPEDGQWYNPAYDDRGPQRFNPDYHRSEPDLGRQINHNRPSTVSLPTPQPHQNHDPTQGPPHPPHSQPFQENASSYSSDSYSRYTSNPVNRHDDSKLREKFGNLAVAAKGEKAPSHNPYRFTRSTANPVNTANIDKSKLSDLSARYSRKDEPLPSRKQSLPSPTISPPVNQPPVSSASSHHAPLQEGAPPRVKKEPPPVPIKTYHLRDRGIEPDDLKIRNYENSNRAYNYADPNGFSTQDKKHQYNDQNENPYDYVAPRQNMTRSRTSPNQNAVYARPYVSPDKHVREGSYDRGRSFMNQIYMDTEQLQKLRSRQENVSPGNPGKREAAPTRDSGYPGSDHPRGSETVRGPADSGEGISGNTAGFSSYKNLITPGFYGSQKPTYFVPDDLGDQTRNTSHDVSDRERSSHEDSDDHGSAFEAYKKPAMSTFGKASAVRGFEPSRHIRMSSPKPDSVIDKINVTSSDVRNSQSVVHGTPPEPPQNEVCGGSEMPRGNASSPENAATLRKGDEKGSDVVDGCEEIQRVDDKNDDSHDDKYELSPTESTGFSVSVSSSASSNVGAGAYEVYVHSDLACSPKYSVTSLAAEPSDYQMHEPEKYRQNAGEHGGMDTEQNTGDTKRGGMKTETAFTSGSESGGILSEQHSHCSEQDHRLDGGVNHNKDLVCDNDGYANLSKEICEEGSVDEGSSSERVYPAMRVSGNGDSKAEEAEEKRIPPAKAFNFPKLKLDRYKLKSDDQKTFSSGSGTNRYRGLLGTHGKMPSYEYQDIGEVEPRGNSTQIYDKVDLRGNNVQVHDKVEQRGNKAQFHDVRDGQTDDTNEYDKVELETFSKIGNANSQSPHAASPNGQSPYAASPNGQSPYAASPNGQSPYVASPDASGASANVEQEASDINDEETGSLVKSPSSNTLVEDGDDDSSTDSVSSDGSIVKCPSDNKLAEMNEEKIDKIPEDPECLQDKDAVDADSAIRGGNENFRESNKLSTVNGDYVQVYEDSRTTENQERDRSRRETVSRTTENQERDRSRRETRTTENQERDRSRRENGLDEHLPVTKGRDVQAGSRNSEGGLAAGMSPSENPNGKTPRLSVDKAADMEVMEILDYDKMYDRPSVGHSLIRGISQESPTEDLKGQEVRKNQRGIEGRKVGKGQELRENREPRQIVRRAQSVERVEKDRKPDTENRGRQTIYKTYRRSLGITKRDVLTYNRDIKETCVDDIYDEVDEKSKSARDVRPLFAKSSEMNGNDKESKATEEEEPFTVNLKRLQLDSFSVGATLSSDTNHTALPLDSASVRESEESAQRSEGTDPATSDNVTRGQGSSTEGSSTEQASALNTFIVGSDTGQSIEGNHTVVATARGVFDHQGGVLQSPETGVSIVIPKAAIPDGVKQEIYFKVCKDNNILPPLDKDKGETLLSPLVMCGPHGLKFLLPVELRLPHCASVNPDSWSFALKSSDSPTGHPTQWQNMTLAGMDGVAQGRVGKNSVSVLVDHF